MTETRRRLWNPGATDNSIRYFRLVGAAGVNQLNREINTQVLYPETFDLRLASATIGSYALRYVAISPTVCSFPAASPGSELDNARWVFVHRGKLSVTAGNQSFVIESGESFTYNPELRCTVEIGSPTSVIVVSEPRPVREQVAYYFPDTVHRYPRSSIVSHSTAAFIGPLLSRRAFPLAPMDVVRVARSLDALFLDLYADDVIDPTDVRSKAARTRSLIIGYVSAAFADPHMGIAQIAQHFGLSERAVHRSFESTGVTAHGLVHRIRLENAVAMLMDQRYAELSIDDVSIRSGFAGGADLRRWMNRVMGISPRDVRNREAQRWSEQPAR